MVAIGRVLPSGVYRRYQDRVFLLHLVDIWHHLMPSNPNEA